MRLLRSIIMTMMLVTLTACVTEPRIVQHQFGFDALVDSPDIQVLNYKYGNSKLPSVRPPEWALRTGQVSQATTVYGAMLRGDFLYVKWRIKSSGKVFEDTVDLKSRLPANIKGDVVYFIIRGPQLYVYLITPQRRPIGWPPNGPRKYDFRKVITIYPDQPKS